MATDDFFRTRIDQMIELSNPQAVLARHMPWDEQEKTLAAFFKVGGWGSRWGKRRFTVE